MSSVRLEPYIPQEILNNETITTATKTQGQLCGIVYSERIGKKDKLVYVENRLFRCEKKPGEISQSMQTLDFIKQRIVDIKAFENGLYLATSNSINLYAYDPDKNKMQLVNIVRILNAEIAKIFVLSRTSVLTYEVPPPDSTRLPKVKIYELPSVILDNQGMSTQANTQVDSAKTTLTSTKLISDIYFDGSSIWTLEAPIGVPGVATTTTYLKKISLEGNPITENRFTGVYTFFANSDNRDFLLLSGQKECAVVNAGTLKVKDTFKPPTKRWKSPPTVLSATLSNDKVILLSNKKVYEYPLQNNSNPTITKLGTPIEKIPVFKELYVGVAPTGARSGVDLVPTLTFC